MTVEGKIAIIKINHKWKIQRTGWNQYEIVERNPKSEEEKQLELTLKKIERWKNDNELRK